MYLGVFRGHSKGTWDWSHRLRWSNEQCGCTSLVKGYGGNVRILMIIKLR